MLSSATEGLIPPLKKTVKSIWHGAEEMHSGKIELNRLWN